MTNELQLPAHFFSTPAQVNLASKYHPVPYRDWHYCKSPRNKHEINPSQQGATAIERRMGQTNTGEPVEQSKDLGRESGLLTRRELEEHFNPEYNRTLRPRYLCFLDKANLRGFAMRRVEEWMSETGALSHPDYIFVAYTAEQFCVGDDGEVLLGLAERAARDAELPAFWCSWVCLPSAGADKLVDDVWRMSDIVRGAKKTAIVVGHPPGQRGPSDLVYLKDMLLGWGKRMWTLPEALLSSKGEKVLVYMRGHNRPLAIEKRSLAVWIWEDAPVSRQLMDHFEGSLILSQLELVVIALQCLNHRDTNDFGDLGIHGEMAYVLMGLLRRRPKVDLTDSAFQAFARLSLANDNNMLLERLICVMPKDQHQVWHDTSDFYDAKLFDIYPTCQIAGIGYDDSVVLDGALGASIRWDRFERVACNHKDSLKRKTSRVVLQITPVLLIVALVFLIAKQIAVGVVLLLISGAVLGASPYLIRLLFTGKLWNTPALLFGFEGYMDIKTIETHLFGANMNRLTWSPFGSPLSRHRPGRHGECVGTDPTTDPDTAKFVGNVYSAANRPGDLKVFTLVDTFAMTVTMFLAERPPVAILLCGVEGGMQRAVLCSFQSSTQTFCREAVLRMETRTRERMSLIGRLRFSFKRSMVAQEGSPVYMSIEPKG